MQKSVAILTVISIVVSSLLAIQVVRDGGLAVGQPNIMPAAVENNTPPPYIQPSNNTQGTASENVANFSSNNVNASVILDAQSTVFNHVFKNAENSVVQITSKVSTVVPNIIINGNPLQSQSTRLGSGFVY